MNSCMGDRVWIFNAGCSITVVTGVLFGFVRFGFHTRQVGVDGSNYVDL